MGTRSKVTLDGGKTWTSLSLDNRHVDDHAIWIDPDDTRHFLIGGDGGVYESFDGGLTYLFKPNLPVTQFYRVFVDNEEPFYNVYGGTQDNNTLAGPSMNKSSQGVSNEDWKAIKGGDGFWAAVDPSDPYIVYCESQYGNVNRYDRKSGEGIGIKPRPRQDEETYKWNWNAPLIISHHSNTRIYMMANKVFRSDDRGNSWEVISEVLTSGMPTIAVRDMTIQEQKNDLVLATFGRGFYIMDDYTPLRELAMNKEILDKAWHIFPVTDALMYIQTGGKYGQGSNFFTSKNPDFGATFTYYLKEVPKTLKVERQEREKELFEEKQPIPQPTREELRAEEAESDPLLIFTIYDEDGNAIRKLTKKASKGVNRTTAPGAGAAKQAYRHQEGFGPNSRSRYRIEPQGV